MRFAGLLTCVALMVGPLDVRAQTQSGKQSLRAPSDSNIVFGNVADAALLMDVYRPHRPNGLGVIFISGSGWGGVPDYTHDYDDIPLKDDARYATGYYATFLQGLLDAGFTVFSVNHRFAPEARFPAPFYDVQRAVRFIRAHAATYGVNPAKLGAIGHSSGAHLAAMLGVADTVIDNPKALRYQAGSSHVQAVVTLAAPFLMTAVNVGRPINRQIVAKLLGSFPDAYEDGSYPMTPAVAAASPLARVTAASAPMLIYQAEDDSTILKTSAPLMSQRLSAAGVPNKLVMRTSGGHAPAYEVGEIVAWFRRYLQ
jgi:acetyl esterase/lipase